MPRGSPGRGTLAFAATMLASLALTAPTAGAVTAQPFIIGGTNATQTYSFMASMQSTDGQHQCGASLIDKQWLVTAAHCVDGQQPSNIQYRIGTTDRTSGGELVKPDKFVAHPESKQKKAGYDIAMVHLSQPMQAEPIKIAATSPQPGAALRLIGWGQTCATPGCGEPPKTLQELDTKTVEPAKCTSAENPFDPARELCIDNKGGKASACYGDSGGPAVVREGSGFALVGASSRGQSENCPEKPGAYSNVVAHTDWINKTMSSGNSSGPRGGSAGGLPRVPPVTLPDMPPGMPPVMPPGMPPGMPEMPPFLPGMPTN